jgi:hypothetical protein
MMSANAMYIEYDQAQYMSLKKFNDSTILYSCLFIKAQTIQMGAAPITLNKIIPGIKKFLKGEFSNNDSGIPNSFPEGEIINTPPPKIAPIPSMTSKNKKMFRSIIMYWLLIYKPDHKL